MITAMGSGSRGVKMGLHWLETDTPTTHRVISTEFKSQLFLVARRTTAMPKSLVDQMGLNGRGRYLRSTAVQGGHIRPP